MKRIALTEGRYTQPQVQSIVDLYARDSGISVVGYYMSQPASLTLLLWPDLRTGYQEPTIKECEQATHELCSLLRGTIDETFRLADDSIHTMMGRRIGGYDTDTVAPLARVTQLAPRMQVHDGYMVSARIHEGEVESYGEPVAIMIGRQKDEAEIHTVGDTLEQHHYAIERTQGLTDFYETKWATV